MTVAYLSPWLYRRSSRLGWLFAGSTTLFILLVGLTVTWSFVRSTEEAALALTERTLGERATRIEKLISERLGACEAVLHTGVGFIDNAWPVTAEQWHRFVQPLLQSAVTLGIQGFGFAGVIERLEPWQLEALPDGRWRSHQWNQEGHTRTAILYLEPQDERNRHAIGFDMASEPVRREAMLRARDQRTAALSGKVTLVQEIDAHLQPGFLLYVPVYERDAPTTTIEERRRALLGYVYSPFRAFDFLNEVFEGEAEDVLIEVYDGVDGITEAAMYRRGMALPPEHRLMYVLRRVSVGGHGWTLQVTATPQLLRANQRVPRWLIFSIGALGTLLLTGLGFAMVRSRQVLGDRLAAEERLLEKEKDAATMLENSLEAFIVINERGEVEEWNKTAADIFGWTRNEVLGRPLADFIVPEPLRKAHINAIRNFHAREHSVLGKRVEMPARRRDGSEIIVALSIASVVRRGRTSFFASLQDITARRQQEARIKELNATLEQRVRDRTQALEGANRRIESAYRDLEAFTRSVSQDLRAPLQAIKGYAALLPQELAPSSEGQRHIDAITATTHRMDRIIHNLLQLASVSQSEVKTEDVMVGKLSQQILAEIDKPEATQVHLEHEQLGCVRADARLLDLALRNLISNAIKFSRTRARPEIWIGATEIDGDRVYYVRDNGVGFDPTRAARLFGAFQRLHSEGEFDGTGLGLTIVKSAIEKNHGRVWAESMPGAGATFYFILPACSRSDTFVLADQGDDSEIP